MNLKLIYLQLFMSLASALNGQYISKVYEYVPAPSQYMNTAPWGLPSSAESIIGGIDGHVSLGSFGGYIIFSFDQPVINHPSHPFGVDFTIFGNPIPNWSEPGIVSVMKDENLNGLPDDTWYELAGSDYHFSTTIKKYIVDYINPGGPDSLDIPWKDNLGNDGFIETNSFFLQPYYPAPDSFPHINKEHYALFGSMIKSTVDTTYDSYLSLKRGFGYADNQFIGKAPFTRPDNPYTNEIENSGGDAFDLSWAVDSSGNYVDLEEIDFIKVHTAVMDNAGWFGQISTEIRGASLVYPEEVPEGASKVLIIRDLPLLIDTICFQLEAFAFESGRIVHDEEIRWTCSLSGATVDENNLLHVTNSGELTLTAILMSDQSIYSTTKTIINLGLPQMNTKTGNAQICHIYPNPARNIIRIQNNEWEKLEIFSISGKSVKKAAKISDDQGISIEELASGIYIVRAENKSMTFTGKFIKE